MEALRSECPLTWAAISQAEATVCQTAGVQRTGLNWVICLREVKAGVQKQLAQQVSEALRKRLLSTGSEDTRLAVRGASGTGTGGFLMPRQEGDDRIPDGYFRTACLLRLGADVCNPGERCQHRKVEDGTLCNEPLDPKGWHSRKCRCGGSRDARHNALRDWHSKFHKDITGSTAPTEQRVVAWDRTHPDGRVEAAILDVCVRDPTTRQPLYVDWTVTCEHSTNAPRRQSRANNDGLAAANQATKKHMRYPAEHGQLVPMAFESGGRAGEEAEEFIRSYGHGLSLADRARVIGTAWRQVSRTLQVGNAEMVISSRGPA